MAHPLRCSTHSRRNVPRWYSLLHQGVPSLVDHSKPSRRSRQEPLLHSKPLPSRTLSHQRNQRNRRSSRTRSNRCRIWILGTFPTSFWKRIPLPSNAHHYFSLHVAKRYWVGFTSFFVRLRLDADLLYPHSLVSTPSTTTLLLSSVRSVSPVLALVSSLLVSSVSSRLSSPSFGASSSLITLDVVEL